MTYYDRLNAFFNNLPKIKLKPSSQLLYLHLLQINNELRWASSFYYSDRMLTERTGLSLRAVSESKAVLKNLGLIDFKTVNHKTKYFLQDSQSNETFSETQKIREVKQKPQGRPSITVPNDNTKEEQNRMRPRVEKLNPNIDNEIYRQRIQKLWKTFDN